MFLPNLKSFDFPYSPLHFLLLPAQYSANLVLLRMQEKEPGLKRPCTEILSNSSILLCISQL